MKGIPKGFAGIYVKATWNDPVLLDLYSHIISELLKNKFQGSILDVGIGPGRLALEIAQRIEGVEVVGVDISSAMVKIAKKNINKAGLNNRIKVLVGDAANLNFEDNSFDMVVSTMTIPFWKEPIQPLSEMHRVLKKPGEAWVYDLNNDTSDEAEQAFRKNYGLFRSIKYLNMMRTSYNLSNEKAHRILSSPQLEFSQSQNNDVGVFVQLRLIK